MQNFVGAPSSISTQLDWDDFLSRQYAHMHIKAVKEERMRDEIYNTHDTSLMSPGSKKLLYNSQRVRHHDNVRLPSSAAHMRQLLLDACRFFALSLFCHDELREHTSSMSTESGP